MSKPATVDVKALKREARQYREHLKALTQSVRAYIAAVDALMEERESHERGKKIGKLTGQCVYPTREARDVDQDGAHAPRISREWSVR